jgi:hypothetical protein
MSKNKKKNRLKKEHKVWDKEQLDLLKNLKQDLKKEENKKNSNKNVKKEKPYSKKGPVRVKNTKIIIK